jgi:hypothetical protein
VPAWRPALRQTGIDRHFIVRHGLGKLAPPAPPLIAAACGQS